MSDNVVSSRSAPWPNCPKALCQPRLRCPSGIALMCLRTYIRFAGVQASRYIRRPMKLLTSREFNRDVSQAKRAAQAEPVVITDRGQPTHVLMSIADYRRLTGEGESILELLAMPEAVALEPADALPDGAWDHREPLA